MSTICPWRCLATSAALVATLVSCAASPGVVPDPAAPSGPNAVIVEVVDGDTVVVAIGGAEERARLIGVDTPETKHPDAPVECFGPEASDRLAALLPPGTPVRLELDEEPRDHYGRLLVYVHRADDAFINEALVREGFADTLAIAPNTAHDARLAAAVATARADRLGLWGACPDAHSPAAP